jgi:hypothetical protein
MKIVDIRTEVPTRNRDSVDRVVSEKGSTFEVTDAPTELHTLIYFTPTEKIVRPGFNGRLTTFVSLHRAGLRRRRRDNNMHKHYKTAQLQ